ncbi:unnamed protein product [Paramecium pentaurelia]|uniref:Uncharacterized protein n=1 Tax=Paramecium pentaurelia TaxID=43138 RepID=A0A8S1W5L8_9CILI|nr:unnamed protein product [Paramecium pentaurelia]
MTTPESLNPAPLTGLGDYSYKKVLEDDYSTGKLNLKFKGNTKSSGIANYKGWLDMSKQQSQQETKFQFPYKNYFLQIATREDGAKVHIDFGEVAKLGNNGSVNLFANAKLGSSHLSQAVIRFGGVTQWRSITHHLRFEYNPANAVSTLSRAFWKNKDWVVVAAEDFQVTNGFGVKRLDLIVGYLSQNYDIFFRHLTEAPNKKKEFSQLKNGRLILDFVYRKNKYTFGLETEYNLAKSQLNALVGASTKIEKVDVKARINVTQQRLGLSGKGKLNDRFNWALSTELPLDGSLPNKQGFLPLPIGFTLDTSL